MQTMIQRVARAAKIEIYAILKLGEAAWAITKGDA
jgi:hypothetical protein